MTLRTRIAAVAGVSVALAVGAVAVGLYVAVSNDLRGEVDKGLRERARPFAQPPPGGGGDGGAQGGAEGPGPQPLFGGEPPPVGAGPEGGEGGPGEGGLPSSVQPAPFGGASGYVQFLAANGTVRVPGGQGSSPAKIPTTAQDRAIARSGSGSSLSDRTVRGVKLRVLTQGLDRLGIGQRGAVMVARPLGEVDSELNRLVAILAIVGAVGIALAAGLGALVARVALAPVRRFTARTEVLTEEGALRGLKPGFVAAAGGGGRGRAGAAGGELQPHARCAGALGGLSAPAGGRCGARAAYADREFAGEHSGAGRSAAAAGGRAGEFAR